MNEYEIEEARKKRKKKAEEDELLMMAFLAGNMGSVYRMDAATEFSGGYD